jgi:phenylalanine-4-hydroxylase
MQAYGIGGRRAITFHSLQKLARLYWYTVEFGLIRTAAGLRIYGSGIVSSAGESVYCLESPAPNRIGFDLDRVMRTRYRIDTYQQTYFVIDSFEQLFAATTPDFTAIYDRLATQPAIAARDVLDSDRIDQRGTREGFAADPDA